MRTFPLPPSLTHEAREYSVCRLRGAYFSHVLVIGQDRQRDVYGLCETTEGFAAVFYDKLGAMCEGAYFSPDVVGPREFIVRKCGGGDEGLYLVRLLNRPVCQCFGYNRWQGCKHIDALADLVRRREI